VEQMADSRRQSLKEPHVRTRAGEFDMAEPFAANLALGNFDTAFVANNAAVLHTFILAAETFPIRHGAENTGTEKPVTFRFERSIVDGFRLRHFAVRPRPDLFRRSEADADRLIICGQLCLAFVIKSKHYFSIFRPFRIGLWS